MYHWWYDGKLTNLQLSASRSPSELPVLGQSCLYHPSGIYREGNQVCDIHNNKWDATRLHFHRETKLDQNLLKILPTPLMTAQTPRTVVQCCRKNLGLRRGTEKGCLIGGKYTGGMQKKNIRTSPSFRNLEVRLEGKGPVSFL